MTEKAGARWPTSRPTVDSAPGEVAGPAGCAPDAAVPEAGACPLIGAGEAQAATASTTGKSHASRMRMKLSTTQFLLGGGRRRCTPLAERGDHGRADRQNQQSVPARPQRAARINRDPEDERRRCVVVA